MKRFRRLTLQRNFDIYDGAEQRIMATEPRSECNDLTDKGDPDQPNIMPKQQWRRSPAELPR